MTRKEGKAAAGSASRVESFSAIGQPEVGYRTGAGTRKGFRPCGVHWFLAL